MLWFFCPLFVIYLHQISVLIHEVIQINIWKEKILPLLIELNDEPTNTFMLHSVFYHEGVAASLLENILFHSDSAQAVDDHVLDLIDYAVTNVTNLLYQKKEEPVEELTKDAKYIIAYFLCYKL